MYVFYNAICYAYLPCEACLTNYGEFGFEMLGNARQIQRQHGPPVF